MIFKQISDTVWHIEIAGDSGLFPFAPRKTKIHTLELFTGDELIIKERHTTGDKRGKWKNDVEIIDFKSAGMMWWTKWKVTYNCPPEEIKAQHDELCAFYRKHLFEVNPEMAKKKIISFEQQMTVLVANWDKTKTEKQAATLAHQEAITACEILARQHPEIVLQDGQGSRFGDDDDSAGILVSFHQHSEIALSEEFTAANLIKVLKRFPQIVNIKKDGSITFNVKDVDALLNDRKTAKELSSMGVALGKREVFYINR